jgi:anti-sigma factor RsiW
MNCTEARAAMLEADLADLAPGAGSELAAHLDACAECRTAAARIVSAEHALALRLAAASPRMEQSLAVARAAAAARRRARIRRLGVSGTLAAAAVAAGLLLLPAGRGPSPSVPAPARATPAGFSVTASPGQSLIVLQPADSTILVVWFLSSRRSS